MLHSPQLTLRLQWWCPGVLSLSPVLSVEDQRSLRFLALLSQRLHKHHDVSDRRMPRAKLLPLPQQLYLPRLETPQAEERRLPRVKRWLTQLRLLAAQHAD